MSEPWTAGGATAQNELMQLLGLDGSDPTALLQSLKNMPVYQALFGNGVDTVLANGSATGGLRGGNTQSSLARVGTDTLAQVYNDRVGQLSNVSQTGLGAVRGNQALGASNAQVMAAMGGDNASALAALFGKIGDTQAGGTLQRSAINTNMLNNVAKSAGKIADSIPGLPF